MTNKQWPVVLTVVSLIGMIGCILFSNPAQNLGAIALIFLFLFGFLMAAGYLLICFLGIKPTPKNLYRLMVIVISIVVLSMFHSAGSLNGVDLIIMVLIILGLTFYINRRS